MLNSKQRKELRAQAHHLKPLVIVGKAGITDNLVDEVKRALESHELIKVKFGDFKEERKELTASLVDQCDAELAGIIGNIGIIYRAHPDEEKRQISISA